MQQQHTKKRFTPSFAIKINLSPFKPFSESRGRGYPESDTQT